MKERDKLNLGNFFTLGIVLFHIWSQSEIRSFWCQVLHKHRYRKGNWVMQANNMTNRNYFMCYCNWKKRCLFMKKLPYKLFWGNIYFVFVTFKSFSIYVASQMMVIENGKTLRFCLFFSSKATVMNAGMVLGGIISTQPNI